MALNSQQRKTSMVMPILLIAIGGLFLFRNWHPGFDPYQFIRDNWKYWPLLLILIGIGKIWDYSRHRTDSAGQPAGAGIALGSTLGVVAFIFVVVILLGHYQKTRHHDDPDDRFYRHASQIVEMRELQGAKSVKVGLHLGAGTLNVKGGSAHLMNADFHYDRKWENPKIEYHVSGDQGYLDVNRESEHVVLGPSENNWDLNFTNDVPLDLHVDMGAGQGNLQLRDMDVTNVELQIGAGQVDVDVTGPRKSDVNISVKGGVGQATIHLPKDVGVQAFASGAIGTVQAAGLRKDGHEYTNAAYGKSPHTIHLEVQGAIGDIELVEE